MNYCEKCHHITPHQQCPYCHHSVLREVKNNDLCFLISVKTIWSQIIQQTLENHHIPYKCINESGSALSLKMGPYLENHSFYVPYDVYNQAKDLTRNFEEKSS